MGDVIGPVASTDDAMVVWDGVSGKAVKNSTLLIGDVGDVRGPLASADQSIP